MSPIQKCVQHSEIDRELRMIEKKVFCPLADRLSVFPWSAVLTLISKLKAE